MDQQTINQIAEILGQSGNAVVNEYVIWHVVSAIGWIVAAVLGIWFTLKWKPGKDNDWFLPGVVIKGIGIFIFAMIVLCNVPDLAAPRAISIHQLLSDIRG